MRHERPVYDMGKACRDDAQIDKRQKSQASKIHEIGWEWAEAAVT